MIELHWLDTVADPQWPAFASLVGRFWHEAIPGERPIPVAELRAGLAAARPARQEVLPVVALDRGRAAGAATLFVDGIRAHSAGLRFLWVAPEDRRRGVGARLLDAVRERARAAGRTRLRTMSLEGDTAAAAFARRVGARAGLGVDQSRCAVAALDAAELRSWVDRAAERSGGYSLVAFDDVCPDHLLDDFAAVIPIMNTAPRTAGTEDLVPSPDEVRERTAAHTRQGNESWTICARHDLTRRLVGYTELSLSKHRPWHVTQGDTGVHPEHRERGLGRWLKAENALRLVAEHPEAEHIETWNASANAAMLTINREMGFRQVAQWREWNMPV